MQELAVSGERWGAKVAPPNALVQMHPNCRLRLEELLRLLYTEVASKSGGLAQLRSYLLHLVARLPSERVIQSRVSEPRGPSGDPLSARECDVLRLMSCGFSNKRIARELQITTETVKSHAKSIFVKLAVQSRAHAVSRGNGLGLI